MRSLRALLIVISSVLLLTNIQPLSAQIVQDERKVKNFENIVVSASENTYVHISHDKSPRVIVKADGRTIHKVKTTVSGDTLTVHLKPDEFGDAKIVIYIKVARLKKVTIDGNGRVDIVDGLTPPDLQAFVASNNSECL